MLGEFGEERAGRRWDNVPCGYGGLLVILSGPIPPVGWIVLDDTKPAPRKSRLA